MSSSLGLQFPVKGSWPAHGHLLRIVIADTTEPFLGPKYSAKFIFMCYFISSSQQPNEIDINSHPPFMEEVLMCPQSHSW